MISQWFYRLFGPLKQLPQLDLCEYFHNHIVVFRFMRKCTIGTIFYPLSIYFYIDRFSRTILHMIQRTIAKQTIDMFCIVTWIILTISIFKITIRIFHLHILPEHIFSIRLRIYRHNLFTTALSNREK